MPEEYYQVQCGDRLGFDELGWWHYQTDLQKFGEINSIEDRITHSRFLVHYAHGMLLYGNRGQALQYAMRRIGYNIPETAVADPQTLLRLEAAIRRTKTTVPA
jgi:hypothetical protein